MKEKEKEIYNNNLSEYSSIIRHRIKDRNKILSCLRMFEYFEDYEKCDDLKNILNNLNDQIDNIH
jgi:hypothetical protein